MARWLLGLLLPDEYREAVLGDLDEELQRRSGDWWSARAARGWYWLQVLHFDLWRLRTEARREGMSRRREEGKVGDVMAAEIRQALRVLRRSPGFASAVVITLGLGIGGSTAVFSLINGLLLRPLPGVEAPGELAAVRTSDYGGAMGVSSYMDFLDFRQRSRSFQSLAAFKPRRADVSAGGATETLGVTMVTSAYFGVLGVRPHVGRFFGAEVDEGPGQHREVVLTHGLWLRSFGGDPTVLGRSVVLNGLAFTVIGVAPEGFRGAEMVDVPDLFVPMTMQAHLMPGAGYLLDRRGWGGIAIVGRLAPGVTHAVAETELEAIGRDLAAEFPGTNESRSYGVLEFRDAALPGGARGGIVQMSALLLAVVAALWLVVCLNVANLFFARSLKRRAELALRRALGAGRARVTAQLVLEFMVLAALAAVLGLVLARGVTLGVAVLPIPVLFDAGVDLRTAAFAGGLAMASGLLCALVPAAVMSRADLRTAAATSPSAGTTPQRWPSRVMIVSQVTLSVILLFSTGLFVRTFANLTSADPGFDPGNLLTATFDPSLQGYDDDQVADFYGRLRERLDALPGVEAVVMADALPAAGNFGRDGWFMENATDPEQSSGVFMSIVSPNFFSVLGIPVLSGRAFTEGDAPGQPVVLMLNEAGARLVEARTGHPAVGQRMSVEGPDGPFFEVVGVVGDSRTGRVRESPPFIYATHAQILPLGGGGRRMVVMLKTTVPPTSLAEAFRRAASAVDPNVSASNLITMDRFMGDLLVVDRLIVTVLGVSSLLALLLVALGVYGLLAYVVTQRTREFGIRVAMGARAATLKGIVVREALALAGVGLLLGAAGGLYLTRFAADQLVGVNSTDPASLAAGIATVVAVTWLAAYVPARRATKVDPVVAMRTE